MAGRSITVASVLVLVTLFLSQASTSERTPLRQPLESLPLDISGWRGQAARDLDPEILAVLGVDEYVNRVYGRSTGAVSLYIGYYASQRQGDSIHSPLNCLPGSGWVPVKSGRIGIPVATSEIGRDLGEAPITIEVNRHLVQRGLDKSLVLYWYQGHGRVVASEYWSKAYMVADAMRLNRTDAALVRVISPVGEVGGLSEEQAEREAVDFVKALFPLLGLYMPA